MGVEYSSLCFGFLGGGIFLLIFVKLNDGISTTSQRAEILKIRLQIQIHSSSAPLPPPLRKPIIKYIHISILNGRKVATTTTQKQQQWIFNRNIHLNNNILWTKLLETWTWNTRKPTFIYQQMGSDHQKRSNGIENCAKALLVGRIQWNSIPIQFEGKKKMTGCCWIVY